MPHVIDINNHRVEFAGCDHKDGDECGCVCHANNINHYGGCCRKCAVCHRNIPKSILMAVKVMRQVERPKSNNDKMPTYDNSRATGNQVAMIAAIAKAHGVVGNTQLLEWLEYESGFKIQIKRLEDLPNRFVSRIKDKLEKLDKLEDAD